MRDWRAGSIRPDQYDRLAGLRDLALLLSDSLTPRGFGQWLHAKNVLVTGLRQIDVLAENRHDDVQAAAESLIEGRYTERHATFGVCRGAYTNPHSAFATTRRRRSNETMCQRS